MSHPHRLSLAEQLRHQIDVWSTLAKITQDDERPNVVKARHDLELAILEARELLATIQRRTN